MTPCSSARRRLVYLEPGADDVPRRTLVWADREGRLEPIDVPPDDYTLARVSPEGAEVALVIGEALEGRSPDIWTLELETQNRRQLTFDFAADHPVWSDD